MTKQSRVDRLAAIEALWFNLRTPGYVEFEKPNGDLISIQPNAVLTVRPSAPGSGNVRIVLPEPAGEIIVVGDYEDVVVQLSAKHRLPANAGVDEDP